MSRWLFVMVAGALALAGTAVVAVDPGESAGWGAESASGGAFLVAVVPPRAEPVATDTPATVVADVVQEGTIVPPTATRPPKTTAIAIATATATKPARSDAATPVASGVVSFAKPEAETPVPTKSVGAGLESATEVAPTNAARIGTPEPVAKNTTAPVKPTISVGLDDEVVTPPKLNASDRAAAATKTGR